MGGKVSNGALAREAKIYTFDHGARGTYSQLSHSEDGTRADVVLTTSCHLVLVPASSQCRNFDVTLPQISHFCILRYNIQKGVLPHELLVGNAPGTDCHRRSG